jgi:hypothetical protein
MMKAVKRILRLGYWELTLVAVDEVGASSVYS